MSSKSNCHVVANNYCFCTYISSPNLLCFSFLSFLCPCLVTGLALFLHRDGSVFKPKGLYEMEPWRLITPLPLNAALSPGGLAAELWAKSTNCPAEAAKAQSPNTPMLSIPRPQVPAAPTPIPNQQSPTSTCNSWGLQGLWRVFMGPSTHTCVAQAHTRQQIHPLRAGRESRRCDCVIDWPCMRFFFSLPS